MIAFRFLWNINRTLRDDISDVKWTIDVYKIIRKHWENLYIGRKFAIYSVYERLFIKLHIVTVWEMAATQVMQSPSNELSTQVSDCAKFEQKKANTYVS